MQLQSIPLEQLLDIFRTARTELIRRKRLNKQEFKAKLREYDWFEDVACHLMGSKSNLHAIPLAAHKQPPNYRKFYLKELLRQDWSHLFTDESSEHCDYYVYAHCDPRQKAFSGSKDFGGVFPGMPFYIGKGRLNRAYDLKRNQGHGLKIREIATECDSGEIVHIIKRGLNNQQALELEAKLVYFFGTIYEKEIAGTLLNLDICKRPDFCDFMVPHDRRKKQSSEEQRNQRKARSIYFAKLAMAEKHHDRVDGLLEKVGI